MTLEQPLVANPVERLPARAPVQPHVPEPSNEPIEPLETAIVRRSPVVLVVAPEFDVAEFTYVLNVRDGGRPPELFDPFMSLPGRRVQNPARFTAARVADTVGEDILARLAARLRAVANSGPVTFDRLLNADKEPQHWLTYSGNVYGHRHSALTDLTPTNVKDLELAWIWQQPRSAGKFEATPLVVDDVLYTVQAPNDVIALDATTGRFLWTYRYAPASEGRVSCCGGRINWGLAILGDTLFMGTIDAHLIAINAKTGALVWKTTVADAADPMCQIPDGWTYCYSTRDPTRERHDAITIRTDAFESDGDALDAGVYDFTWYLLDVRTPVHGAG